MNFGVLIAAHAGKATALACAASLYLAAELPRLDAGERATLASRFAFDKFLIEPADNGRPFATQRTVHPDIEHIGGWISSVGAAVALADADGDRLANDICLVDPRNNSTTILPAPTTPDRYEAILLDNPTAEYEPATIAPMGCLPGDMNEDGRMDFLVYFWGRPPVAFIKAEGGPPTRDGYRIVEITNHRERWFSNAAIFADVNGDGHPDLIVGNYFPDGAGILDATGSAPVEMQHSMSRAYNAGMNRLLIWKNADSKTVAYEDYSDALPEQARNGWTLALAAADLDGDLLPEIYFANDFGPDRLLHNRSQPGDLSFTLVAGERTMTIPRSKVLGRDSFKGMGVDFADVNGDGRLDIFVSNIAEEYALQESHFLYVHTGDTSAFRAGIAPFVDQSEPLGLSRSAWSWDAKLADFDNDGTLEVIQATGFLKGEIDRWPELHELAFGNDELLRHPFMWPRFGAGDDLSGHEHNRFFVQDHSGVFRDIAVDLNLGEPNVSRGIAVGDIDGDGDLDVVIANQWEGSALYRNTAPLEHASLILDVRVYVGSNGATRPAIGARATVTLPDGRRLVGQVDGGNGHSGKRAPQLHFGLAELPKDKFLEVELAWRDAAGSYNEIFSLKPGYRRIVLPAPAPIAQTGNRAIRESRL